MGLRHYKEFEKEKFDILLADIKMPKVNGLTLLKEVKEEHPHTEIIIITGFGSIESAVDAMKRGSEYKYPHI